MMGGSKKDSSGCPNIIPSKSIGAVGMIARQEFAEVSIHGPTYVWCSIPIPFPSRGHTQIAGTCYYKLMTQMITNLKV